MAQFNPLSQREWEVVEQLLQGKSNKLIAASLGISDRTVEFHLKNIYAKYKVSSRVELILKLGNATGMLESNKLGRSTVDKPQERAENRYRLNSRTDWASAFRKAISMIGKEFQMKTLFNSKHVPVGVITALFVGFLWVILMRRFGHASMDSIKPWILPLVVILTLIGASVGLIGKSNGNAVGKVFISTLFGAGVGSIAMVPLTLVVVYPLGKLAEALGLVNRAAISVDLATTLVYAAMLAIWLIVGIAIGTMFSFVTIKRSKPADFHRPAAEHGM